MPYLQNATHEGFIFNEATKAEFAGNGTHAAMAMRYFVANLPTGQLDGNNQPIYANYNIGQAVGLYSSNGTGANLTEIYLDPVKLAITATETELSNVTVWSANSILTQSRGDSRYIADSIVGNISTSYGNDLFYGQHQTRHASPGFPFVAGGLLTNSRGIVGVSNTTDPCNIEFHPGESFNQMRFRSYDKIIVLNNDGFSVETGTANWTWSANSILTQGRGDSRYQPVGSYLANATTWLTTDSGTDQIIGLQSNTSTYQTFSGTGVFGSSYLGVRTLASNTAISYIKCDPIAAPFGRVTIFHNGTTFTFNSRGISVGSTANFTWGSNDFSTVGFNDARYQNAANNTWANLTGKPTLATVATSGNYNDLSNKPASYTLPAATNSTLGGIIVGANLSVSANGTLSANIPAGGGSGVTAAKSIAYSMILGR